MASLSADFWKLIIFANKKNAPKGQLVFPRRVSEFLEALQGQL